MKSKTLAKVPPATHPEIQSVHIPRFHIYRQTRAGSFTTELKTDSATEAVEMFAIMSPAFEGGKIRIWDNWERRVCAAVQWKRVATAFGFIVRQRQDAFQNPILALLARQQVVHENFSKSILTGPRRST